MLLSRCIFVAVGSCLLALALGYDNNEKVNKLGDEELLAMLLDSKVYKIQDRPTEAQNKSTIIDVYITVSQITDISVRDMEFTMDMLLRQEWDDPRLAWKNHKNSTIRLGAMHKKKINSPTLADKLWLPDLFFRNGKRGNVHTMTMQNTLYRVTESGHLLWSQKVTMKFACEMKLQKFPMDEQKAVINIGSYGYTWDQLKFKWSSKVTAFDIQDNIQISEFIRPEKSTEEDCTNSSGTSTGQYSCLKSTFYLKRQLSSWLTSTYLPNILIIFVSWLSFWISLDAIPARVTLGLLSMLATLTQASSMANTLPRVSYIKAIDVWTIACIAFDIAVLIEFAIASNMAKKEKDQGWMSEVQLAVRDELARWCVACQQQHHMRGPNSMGVYYDGPNLEYSEYVASTAIALKRGKLELCEQMEHLLNNYQNAKPHKPIIKPISIWQGQQEGLVQENAKSYLPPTTGDCQSKPNPAIATRKPKKTSEIDEYSRFLFPTCFLLFNCAYWSYYIRWWE